MQSEQISHWRSLKIIVDLTSEKQEQWIEENSQKIVEELLQKPIVNLSVKSNQNLVGSISISEGIEKIKNTLELDQERLVDPALSEEDKKLGQLHQNFKNRILKKWKEQIN